MDDKMILVHSKDICHHGVDGQKWGKRQYQYDDGSLTPLGRIHYGVGQAKEASKIKIREMKAETRNAVKLAKAQAKTANEVAKAEAKKLEAEAKAYRDRKEADKMVELERIKNDREADRNAARLEEKRIDNEDKLNRDLAETSKEQVESEKSSSNALKVVGGVLVAAGVGYLLYRAVKGSSVTSEGNIEAGKNAINSVSDKPASSFFNTANETQRQKDLIGKAIKDKNAAEASFIKSQAKAAAKEAKRQKDLITQAVKASNKAKAKEAKAAAKELKRQQNLIKKTINFENNSKKSWYVDPKLGNKFRVTTEGRGSRLSNWLFGPITTRSEKAQKTLDAIDSWKKRRLYMSDNDGMILIHSATAGRDVEHWGIKGQKWGVRRWQYEDGSLTPEGRIHYGRISEKGQQEGRLTGRTAKFNTREFNTLNRRMARNASKYEKTGKRKYAERALENAELLSNEKFVKNEARIMKDQSSAHYILGIPGQILMAAANSSLLKEDQNIWNEAKAKFEKMSLDELDKAFNETIGKTEKVKFNAKEMDKETKAKEDAKFKASKEYREIGEQYKNEKEARKAYGEHKKVAENTLKDVMDGKIKVTAENQAEIESKIKPAVTGKPSTMVDPKLNFESRGKVNVYRNEREPSNKEKELMKKVENGNYDNEIISYLADTTFGASWNANKFSNKNAYVNALQNSKIENGILRDDGSIEVYVTDPYNNGGRAWTVTIDQNGVNRKIRPESV